jgi:phosphatidylglycerol lysyltransferase
LVSIKESIRVMQKLRPSKSPLNYETISVKAVAVLAAVMGVINIFSAITPALLERARVIRRVFPLEVRHSGRLSAILAGFALLLLSGHLGRRKRMAWLITVIVLIISVISHLIKGLDYEEAILALLLTIWLLTLFPVFHARSDRASLKKGVRVLIFSICFTIVYGITGFYLLDHHFSIDFNFLAAVKQTFIMFTEFYDPGLQPTTELGRFFANSIYSVGALTIGYSLLLFVRPVFIHRHQVTAAEKKQAEMIVCQYGGSSIARFTLFPDKIYFFSSGGSMISYVNKKRTALVLGDPIGPPADALPAITEFVAFCAHNDWQPAFYQAHPEYLPYYKTAGLMAICIGHEAIVALNSFTLAGKAGKDLRPPVNRLTKLGFQAIIQEPPLSDALLAELQVISDEWLTMMHGSEKQFSLGFFDPEYLRNCPVITIVSPEGQITAFANVITEYQRNEVTVDLMRRRRNMTPGTMEFLFVSFFQWAQTKNYTGFNLGLSALSGVGSHPDDPRIERALFYIYEHINQFYNFKGLHQFKEKFNPYWEPRYLICPNPASLPAVLTALVRADSGDDFLMRFLRGYGKFA